MAIKCAPLLFCRPGGGSRRVWCHSGRHPGARHVHRWGAACTLEVWCGTEARTHFAGAGPPSTHCMGAGSPQKQQAYWSRGSCRPGSVACCGAHADCHNCLPGPQARRCWAASTWRSTLTSARWPTCEWALFVGAAAGDWAAVRLPAPGLVCSCHVHLPCAPYGAQAFVHSPAALIPASPGAAPGSGGVLFLLFGAHSLYTGVPE